MKRLFMLLMLQSVAVIITMLREQHAPSPATQGLIEDWHTMYEAFKKELES